MSESTDDPAPRAPDAAAFLLAFKPQAEKPTEAGDYLLYNQCDGYHLAEARFDGAEFEGFFPWMGDRYDDDTYQAWAKLADKNNTIGNVQLPTACVTRNLHSLRAAIDDAMRGGGMRAEDALALTPNAEPTPMKPLKPCPFCLTEGEKLIELWDTFDAGHIAHIHCEHCGADGPSVYGEIGAAPTITRARSMWNGRAHWAADGRSERVRPALGYKYHAQRARSAGLDAEANFIEAQNAEIEYLYSALQSVRDRAKRASSRNEVAHRICSEANFALQYGA